MGHHLPNVPPGKKSCLIWLKIRLIVVLLDGTSHKIIHLDKLDFRGSTICIKTYHVNNTDQMSTRKMQRDIRCKQDLIIIDLFNLKYEYFDFYENFLEQDSCGKKGAGR